MKLVEMWKLFVKPHEELTACYAKILHDFQPLKCRYMIVKYYDEIMLYNSPKQCVCADDDIEYILKNVTMIMEDENYFMIYVEVE